MTKKKKRKISRIHSSQNDLKLFFSTLAHHVSNHPRAALRAGKAAITGISAETGYVYIHNFCFNRTEFIPIDKSECIVVYMNAKHRDDT